MVYGESDFSMYPHGGPYKVGLKSIKTSKYGNEVWVYYPVDKETLKEN